MIENNNEQPTNAINTNAKNDIRAERPNSRRESVSSQISSSTTSPHYDSGNISDLNLNFHPASLSSADDDSISSDSLQQNNKYQFLLREKDQSLFLALQDVRKLKSELERLSKSEKWYKSELKLQRNSKLEVLEKLYTNERKFTQDNQNLQNERIALFARCSELENQLQIEKDSAMRLLKTNHSRQMIQSDEIDSKVDFELEQHRQRLADQNQLIDILRNQKRSLLNDLQKLGCERDEIVLQLQKSIAQLEDENRTITKRCLQLVESKIALTDEIAGKEADWKSTSNEVLDLQIVVRKLQEKLHTHIAEINHKDKELTSLKNELSQKQDTDSDLLIKHQKELFEKEQSISNLTETINSLKTEISDLQDLHKRYNDQQLEIEHLRSQLQEQTSQIEIFQKLEEEQDSNPIETLENPKQNNLVTNAPPPTISNDEQIEQILKQNKQLQTQLDSIKSSQSFEHNNLKKIQTEMQQISEKYQNVCKLYETSKFDLDMRDITIEKLRFEKEKDTREIKSLREKLIQVTNQLDCQRTLGTEFEFLLSKTQQEMNRLKSENQCNIDKIIKLKVETNQSAERLNEKDLQIDDLKAELLVVKEQNAKLISNNTLKVLQDRQNSQNRVELMQQLMSLQVGRVEQLNAEQQEWENLLTALDNPKNDDHQVQSSEFDDLNQLFDEQNIELDELNENYHKQSESFRKALDLSQKENQIFKNKLNSASLKINELESRIQAMESANVDYQKEIAHLAGTNERLIQEFNKDFSKERESHKKQIKQFQLKAKLRREESDRLREKLQTEIDQLKSSQKLNDTIEKDQHVQQQNIEQDRILQNVLETEHQRKMIRYDLHIRSLLSNVKSYKKNLEVVENRYDALKTKSKDMVEVEQLRAMESALQDMRMQFENSQMEINNLKHQLKTMNEQFYATDASKSSNAMDMTNLMDDYKKLIQQSQIITTKQPSTSEIYKLINKSNSFVPKLTNISNSVNKLREDIQQVCTVINVSSSGRAGSPQLKLSLMDELKLADNKNFT
ncbi:interaptin [Episyrphus balteatus]|uniref:interaptin n=1 Tax=Episyrphus balteatus TaxID=286459 RepID=UPI00248568A5|nr:interaptin [Episyrphus balteatus]